MSDKMPSSRFQDVIETVEALPPDDQELLIELIRQRLIQHRRSELVSQVAEAREAYQTGNVRRGAVDELLRDLDTKRPWSGVPALPVTFAVRSADNLSCVRGLNILYDS